MRHPYLSDFTKLSKEVDYVLFLDFFVEVFDENSGKSFGFDDRII